MKKVVCLGLHKTGTATFREAVKILGWTNFSNSRDDFLKYIKNGELLKIKKYMEEYDAFKAWPWAILYKEIDQWFPDTKFVLTTRDLENWLNSSIRHFGREHTDMREYIFGSGYPKDNEIQYLCKYMEHYINVVNYFFEKKGGFDQLLVVNWESGDGWDKLCSFLGVDILKQAFPWANKKKGKHKDLCSKS